MHDVPGVHPEARGVRFVNVHTEARGGNHGGKALHYSTLTARLTHRCCTQEILFSRLYLSLMLQGYNNAYLSARRRRQAAAAAGANAANAAAGGVMGHAALQALLHVCMAGKICTGKARALHKRFVRLSLR